MSVALLVKPGQAVGLFGPYLAEILRCEGLMDHQVLDLDDLAVDDLGEELARYDLVLLSRMNLTRRQAKAVISYVEQGGRLVAIRPQRQLADLFGLGSSSTMTDRAYVLPLDGTPIGAGVPHEPIQTHLPADNYFPNAGTTVAQLYGDAKSPSSFPAIIHRDYGAGQIVIFAYDIAQAISRIRQGDPDRVGGRGMAMGSPYRNSDLLVGYTDPACWHLPQADIHAMLLGNAINLLARHPQPRLWYFPTPEIKSVLILDSDDDWSRPEHFDALINGVERHGGHITIYLMLSPNRPTVVTPEQVADWRSRGHSFGVHHDAYDPSYDGADEEETLEDAVRTQHAAFLEQFGGVPAANRNHCAAWNGYVDLPKLYEELGIGMDLNTISHGQGVWLSYLSGSGRPMRFVDLDGRVIDVFQQLTQAYDDMSVMGMLSADPAGEAAATRRLMEDKINTYFSPLSMLSHPVSFHSYSQEYQERCWAAARELGMPIWSAAEWAEFVRARDAARIHDVQRTSDGLQLSITGRSPQGSLTLMLPIDSTKINEITVDGQSATLVDQPAFGWDYALVKVDLPAHEEQTRTLAVRLNSGR